MPYMVIAIFIDASSYSSRRVNTRNVTLLRISPVEHLKLLLRLVRSRVTEKHRNVIVGGHETLNMFDGELNLLCLLRNGRAGIKQIASQKRGEHRAQKGSP